MEPLRSSLPVVLLAVSSLAACRSSLPCTIFRSDGPEKVPDCLVVDRSGGAALTRQTLRHLVYDIDSLAVIRSDSLGWAYVDRSGRVVVYHVATMDNGADAFSDGLVRFERGGKWGFADRRGNEVVPPVYDGSYPFENGVAHVCRACRLEPADPRAEHHTWTGGTWSCIDLTGATIDCPAP